MKTIWLHISSIITLTWWFIKYRFNLDKIEAEANRQLYDAKLLHWKLGGRRTK